MKTVKISLPLIFVTLFLAGCRDFEFGEEKFKRIGGPSDVIPYEALGSGKLAFDRDDNVFIIDADSKSTWGITGYRGGGVLSPDGSYVALELVGSSGAGETPSEIVLYNIGADKFTTIPGSEYSNNPSWTADSKYVLCLSYGESNLSLVRQFGTGENKSTITKFTLGAAGNYGSPPVTSRVSASVHDDFVFSLSYSTPGNIDSGIFTIKLNGAGLTEIVSDTSATTRATSPYWSPNGEQIAYMQFQYKTDVNFSLQQTKIIVMNGDGSDVSTLATFQAAGIHTMIYAIDPPTYPSIAWSPDGTRLAFNRYEEDGVHVYVLKLDGSGLTQVTSEAGRKDGQLSWSR